MGRGREEKNSLFRLFGGVSRGNYATAISAKVCLSFLPHTPSTSLLVLLLTRRASQIGGNLSWPEWGVGVGVGVGVGKGRERLVDVAVKRKDEEKFGC